MSLNPYIKPFSLKIEASLQKWLIIIIPHLLGILLTISVDTFPVWLKFILGIFIFISFIYFVLYHITLNQKKSVFSIQQDSVRNWLILLSDNTKNNEPIDVQLLPSSFISRYLIVLNFQDNKGSYYSVIILPDSISSINFKYLYIRLKTTYIK